MRRRSPGCQHHCLVTIRAINIERILEIVKGELPRTRIRPQSKSCLWYCNVHASSPTVHCVHPSLQTLYDNRLGFGISVI